MLVYGDRKRRCDTNAMLDAVAAGGETAFFDAAELAQGLIDEEFGRRRVEDLTPVHSACMDLMASVLRRQGVVAAASRLRRLPLPRTVESTVPEGYAFYALYPDAYARAARQVRSSGPPLVIGLRSIGTGLAAVVAAASGGEALTLRPVGHPFQRRVTVSPLLCDRLRAHAGEFAIVDEGPGLSGSSFEAAARLLEGLDVVRDRILFFPSHRGGPGAEASQAVQHRWNTSRRHVATLDDLLTEDPIDRWFERDVGPALNVEDLSGGAWRTPTLSPPADPVRERRKFRITTADGVYLARFAGLGRIGAEKFERAKALHVAGFSPSAVALHRGFLLQPWQAAASRPFARRAFVDHLSRYIAFRARAFPAEGGAGADPQALADMIAVNSGVQVAPPPPQPRVHVDARLQAWEWLCRDVDGGFCKVDAVDHSCGHDLVGCQPVEYDVAGAIVEHRLSRDEANRLAYGVAKAGGPAIDRAALRFFLQAYLSFQQGLWALAEPSQSVAARRWDLRRASPGSSVAPSDGLL